jgi:thymidine phosphorylase
MIGDFLAAKRDGRRHPPESIAAFVHGVVDGSVSRPQAAAWLAFAYTRGLDDNEAVALTRAMTHSGALLSWPGIEGPFVDKHSTGGVGDKVSLVLAPLWAELGWKVPMISGRGLGHTGGTLDKLEAIPGYRTDLDDDALRRALIEVGCFINGQTAQLAPADRVLYALRNETETVPCIPLIVASILSKKLAEGLDRLVLDVKVGSGAFMTNLHDARALAESLVRVGKGAGVATEALLTDMEQPLGVACGNGNEVEEAVACLEGRGPADLREATIRLAMHPDAERVLDSGAARERFARMVHAHGGDLDRMDLVSGVRFEDVLAPENGFVTGCDARSIGRAVFVLGAGRSRAEDPVLFPVGVDVYKKVGEPVEKGEHLARIRHVGRGLEQARHELATAWTLGDRVAKRPLVLGHLT